MLYVKPKNKPKANATELEQMYLKDAGYADAVRAEPLCLVGIRGYYENTFGRPQVNDRIYYDDALFLIDNKENHFLSFNFNADPSYAFKHNVAMLKANEVYTVVKHRHKGKYPALQIVRDILKRDGIAGYDTGRHGINFHYDAEHYSKDSLGCQTIPRSQWAEFIDCVYSLMSKHKLKQIHYYLIEK